MNYKIYLKKIYFVVNYINNVLRLPMLYNIIQNNLFKIKYYVKNISINKNENEYNDDIIINDSDVENISDDSMFLDNEETENKENLKESVLVLSKYFKSKLESSNYQRIGIATRLMQKNYRKHKELRLIKSTNNIDDLKVEDVEEGYYSIISKSLSYLGW